MNLLSKIALSGKFGKSIYVISGLLTVAMCSLVLLEPVAAAACRSEEHTSELQSR